MLGILLVDLSVSISLAKVSMTVNQLEKCGMADGIVCSPVSDERLCCTSLVEAPLNEADAAEVARVLAALADPVRLRLLSLVAAASEICSCDLEGPLAKSQPTVSHHTKVLADAGLLIGEKRGRWTWWRLDPDRLAAVRQTLGG
jgi:ArsR family transcriptional regulator